MQPIRIVSLALLSSLALTSAAQPSGAIRHWAFQPVQTPIPPAVLERSWPRNPIDQFVLAQLEEKNLRPTRPADAATLLRRVTLDLTGLPPTPQELNAFLAEPSEGAYLRAVEQLLASPRYGERWARHWLDLARYAESEGFKADETRPNAWRYRDYLVGAFNQDKPYDRFVQEQIAGDELWPGDPDALVATAFNRHYPDESNARNLRQRRQEILNDITDTVGVVFAGLTFACARCHDHKFDPISQADYYRLQAFFANTTADDHVMLVPEQARAEHDRRLREWEEKTFDIRQEMSAIEAPERKAILLDYTEKYPDEIRAALETTEGERTPFERLMVAKANLYLDPSSHQYIASKEAVAARLKGDQKKRWEQLNKELQQFASLKPASLPVGMGMHDVSPIAPATHRLNRGAYDALLDRVEPGFLPDLGFPAPSIRVNGPSTGRRAALAEILTDPSNPLTARIMVNRLWHYHFGQGLVGTPSDFGERGERPTHPELLDWLAQEFVRSGWSVKHLHRLMVSSSTYRQSTQFNKDHAAADPQNQLLWRFPRQRLAAETIRDSILSVAGLMNPAMGGPSVFPQLPAGMTVRGGWEVTPSASERNRRSIYVFVRRNTRYPMFLAFDMPDTHESCARRSVTTSPVQALTLLNSDLSLDWARAFAGRVIDEAGPDLDAQITHAYQLAFARLPDQMESATVRDFIREQRALIAERQAAGQPLALPDPCTVDPVTGSALVDFCHMLINANEFVYQN